jgi:hypothetical protein
MYEMSFKTKEDGVDAVLNALLVKPNLAIRLAELATEALRSSIYLAIDAELITDHWDSLDRGLPPIAAHVQNEYHDGVIHLIRLLTGVFPYLSQQNPLLAGRLAEQWRALPSALGGRLWLYVLRRREPYSIAMLTWCTAAFSPDHGGNHEASDPMPVPAIPRVERRRSAEEG